MRNAAQFDDIANAHIGIGHAVLFNEGDPARKLLFGDAGDVLTVQRHTACIRAAQASQNAQKR